MKIISMKWSEVPAGAIVLCPDGVQREIGPNTMAPEKTLVRRRLGLTGSPSHTSSTAEYERDAMTLVVAPDPESVGEDSDWPGVILMFMRAGFTVEVLPG